jgi:nitric oxide dioxygenase
MKERVEEICSKHANVKSYTVYGEPAEGEHCDKTGYIDYEWLHSIIPTNDAAFYFCGPKGFMRAAYQNLSKLNVADSDIHYEVFGPAEDMSA